MHECLVHNYEECSERQHNYLPASFPFEWLGLGRNKIVFHEGQWYEKPGLVYKFCLPMIAFGCHGVAVIMCGQIPQVFLALNINIVGGVFVNLDIA